MKIKETIKQYNELPEELRLVMAGHSMIEKILFYNQFKTRLAKEYRKKIKEINSELKRLYSDIEFIETELLNKK